MLVRELGAADEELSSGRCSGSSTGSPTGAVLVDRARSSRFTMRSSSDWYDSTTTRPPTASRSTAAGMARASTLSSWLTSMRSAWKTRLAGCPALCTAAGVACWMISTSRADVVIGSTSRAWTMRLA